MGKKYTLSQVNKKFKSEGYLLLEQYYQNTKQKLSVICPNNHETKITFTHFCRGVRCKKCWDKRKSKSKLTSIEEIKEIFAQRGYNLLSTEYVDPACYLESLCPRGHPYRCRLPSFKSGYGCAKCAAMNNSGPNNHGWNPNREEVKQNRKIWTAWRNTLRSAVSGKNKKTSAEIKVILGYDWDQLRDHLQKHPNWEQVKDTSYHVDHVFPVCAFLKYGIKDPKIVCDLDNLRPLSAQENMKKNRYYSKQEFEAYLREKGLMKE